MASQPSNQIATGSDVKEIHKSTRHIVFDFSLVDGGRVRLPSDEEFDILSTHFPSTYSVGVCGVFLVIRVTELPPKPWPLSVAGLPFYITTDKWDVPWSFGSIKGQTGKHALEEINARHHVNDEIFPAAIKWFDEKSNVTISSILWAGGMWQVTIADDSNLSDLPCRLCQAGCTYLYQSETSEQQKAALRQKNPTITIHDDTKYNILRPGVMISSTSVSGDLSVPRPSELYTTAGVLVKDEDGNEFMTVAGHGFPLGEETVCHPNRNGTIVGEVERRLSGTDIALVRLRNEIVFENKPFQSTQQPAKVEITQIIASPFELEIGEILYMDNPFTGPTESIHFATERRRVPSDENGPQLYWVTQNWSYYGQSENSTPQSGSCGSPIWDAAGKLVCFFTFLISDGPRKGMGVGVSAAELRKFGLDISGSR